jgi:hypothetical protein
MQYSLLWLTLGLFSPAEELLYIGPICVEEQCIYSFILFALLWKSRGSILECFQLNRRDNMQTALHSPYLSMEK